MAKFHFKSFSNLDEDQNADFFINSMEVMFKLDSIKKIKQNAIQAMNLNIGDTVLEVGCGHGMDAEAIAAVVGANGKVEAIDASIKMIIEAQRLSKHKNVQYFTMSAKELRFDDNKFSACHADRLLIGHEDYNEIFMEMLRVVKPRGTICITDPDALSTILYPFDNTSQKILNQMQKVLVNPSMGRMLPELFAKHGLKNIRILPELSIVDDFNTLSQIFFFPGITNNLIANGEMAEEEAQQWTQDMHKASEKRKFLYCITFFTVVGQK